VSSRRATRRLAALLSILLGLAAGAAIAQDELVTSLRYRDDEPVPYVLTTAGSGPSHAVILLPGGAGNLSYAHHGFNGIEKETVARITAWIIGGR